MPHPPGELVQALRDRYRLERELGQGGMATVYLAHDVRHDRQVAVKVLRPELAASVGADRFLREIHLAAALHHPHILPVYDSGEVLADSGPPALFYVMPYVEGETLRSKIARERQLPVDEAVQIAREVADALAYAHGHGVIHRDVKPENILLESGHALVADFGIARPIAHGESDATLTDAGIAVGTPWYMSPEQATADRALDARTDVYSLGCVVYEMLAGQPPFTGPTVEVITRQHITTTPPPITQYRPAVATPVADVLARALAKAPGDRYRTTSEFAEALRVATTASSPAAARAPAATWTARRGRRLVIAGVGAVAIAAGVLLALARSRAAATGPELDPRRLAVLYLADRTPEGRLGYIADGITESLIHELSDVEELQVISANGVAPFRGKPVALDSIGRALRVGTIVTGQLQMLGDSLRLSVAMSDANDATETGHATFELPRSDALAFEDSAAAKVSVFLRERLGEEIAQLKRRAGTRNAAAWEMLQKGEAARRAVDELLASGDTAGAARRHALADSLYAAAGKLDGKWIEPELRRGWLAWQSLHLYGFDKTAAASWTNAGLAHADEALAMEPDNPEALHLRGAMHYVQYLLNLDVYPLTSEQVLAGAEQDLRAGTALANPRRAQAWSLLSHLLSRTSRNAEARLAALRAYETDPYLDDAGSLLTRLALSAIDLGDAAEATRWCAEGYRRFPKDPAFTECQIERLALGARPEDIGHAWALRDSAVALYPPAERDFRRRRADIMVAMAAARAGLVDSARAIALRARTDDPAVDPARDLVYLEVLLRNMLGDRDEALGRLAVYLATNPQDRANVAADQTWWLAGLRDDSRFTEMVRTR